MTDYRHSKGKSSKRDVKEDKQTGSHLAPDYNETEGVTSYLNDEYDNVLVDIEGRVETGSTVTVTWQSTVHRVDNTTPGTLYVVLGLTDGRILESYPLDALTDDGIGTSQKFAIPGTIPDDASGETLYIGWGDSFFEGSGGIDAMEDMFIEDADSNELQYSSYVMPIGTTQANISEIKANIDSNSPSYQKLEGTMYIENSIVEGSGTSETNRFFVKNKTTGDTIIDTGEITLSTGEKYEEKFDVDGIKEDKVTLQVMKKFGKDNIIYENVVDIVDTVKDTKEENPDNEFTYDIDIPTSITQEQEKEVSITVNNNTKKDQEIYPETYLSMPGTDSIVARSTDHMVTQTVPSGGSKTFTGSFHLTTGISPQEYDVVIKEQDLGEIDRQAITVVGKTQSDTGNKGDVISGNAPIVGDAGTLRVDIPTVANMFEAESLREISIVLGKGSNYDNFTFMNDDEEAAKALHARIPPGEDLTTISRSMAGFGWNKTVDMIVLCGGFGKISDWYDDPENPTSLPPQDIVGSWFLIEDAMHIEHSSSDLHMDVSKKLFIDESKGHTDVAVDSVDVPGNVDRGDIARVDIVARNSGTNPTRVEFERLVNGIHKETLITNNPIGANRVVGESIDVEVIGDGTFEVCAKDTIDGKPSPCDSTAIGQTNSLSTVEVVSDPVDIYATKNGISIRYKVKNKIQESPGEALIVDEEIMIGDRAFTHERTIQPGQTQGYARNISYESGDHDVRLAINGIVVGDKTITVEGDDSGYQTPDNGDKTGNGDTTDGQGGMDVLTGVAAASVLAGGFVMLSEDDGEERG